MTYETILGRHDVAVPAHLLAQAEVPVLTGLQRQGDVAVVPVRPGLDRGDPVPPEGVAVVRGEAMANTHLLVADGDVRWRAAGPGSQVVGTFTVAEDATAWLLHPEHGAQGIGPGTYAATRQREQADVVRQVAD